MRGSPPTPLAVLLMSLCLGVSACATLPRPTGPETTVWRDARVLDASPATRLVVEVDRFEGSEPRPRALRLLMKRLRHTLDKPGGIHVEVDDLVPLEEFAESDRELRRVARRYRSQAQPARDEVAVLHLLYAPRLHRYRGYAFTRPVMVAHSPRYDAGLVLVFAERLKPILWISGVRQEASVLVHEVGHTLGLAADPSHSDRGHCTNAWCSMYDGVDVRTVLLYLFPTLFTGYLPVSYCRDCLADLHPRSEGVRAGARR